MREGIGSRVGVGVVLCAEEARAIASLVTIMRGYTQPSVTVATIHMMRTLAVLGDASRLAIDLRLLSGTRYARCHRRSMVEIEARCLVAQLLGQAHSLQGHNVQSNYRAELGGEPPSLVGPASRVKADGKIDININGLPQGARVDQKPAGDIPFNVNAGYRSDALGMAW